MKWFDLFKALFGTKLDKAEVEIWESELKAHSVSNEGLCDIMRHIENKDYTPRADKNNATSKYTLADLRLWVFIYRKEVANQDPDFADAHSELGFRRMLLGKMKEAWEAGDPITALRITTHPEYIEGLEDARGPSPEDSAWLVCKAEEQFGYDQEEALRAWVADRKAKDLPFYGSNLLQDMADNMNPGTTEPQPQQYDEEEMLV
ncbi:MAG: hypothetical protein DRI46_11345 [Chloroflexi bacterium]|nr:MAG: hypothetical protein DRI46_11345 [Chloroflexota bacterium]